MSENQNQSTEIVVTPRSTLREALLATVRLDSQQRFFDATCAICRSKHREDVERLYAHPVGPTDRALQVVKFLEEKGESVTLPEVRNHRVCHMEEAAETELRRAAYMEQLLAIANSEKSNMDRLRLVMAALEERLFATVALPGNNAHIQSQKTKDVATITKSMTQVIALMLEIVGEMADRGEVVAIPKNKFKQVIEKAIGEAKTVEEKQAILRLFKAVGQEAKE